MRDPDAHPNTWNAYANSDPDSNGQCHRDGDSNTSGANPDCDRHGDSDATRDDANANRDSHGHANGDARINHAGGEPLDAHARVGG